ncbi:MAG: hydroxypyruvate isomerase [Burkholderiales bacterium]|nr:hydroxypyruvate isomerase [Burkholderiales bacterium]
MPNFSANISMLFTEHPFLDRFEAAARAGFRAVEFQFPYDHRPTDIKARLDVHGLKLVLHNLPAGNWTAGERGIACHPARMAEFREGVQLALEYAAVLGTPRLNALAGIQPADVSDQTARATLLANLKFAADKLAERGIQLLMEPINTFDVPGFFVNRTPQALSIIRDVHAMGSRNLFLQYDIYHAQRMEGELAATLQAAMPHIAHIQVADNPGRNEPGTGEINYPYLFAWLDRVGYTGHIGCEYKPQDAAPGGTLAGLGWLAALGGTQ